MNFSRRSLFAVPLMAVAPGVAAASVVERGTGDLGIVIERASSSILIVEATTRTILARLEGLGDMSHATVVFSPDQRYGFVFAAMADSPRLISLKQKSSAASFKAGIQLAAQYRMMDG